MSQHTEKNRAHKGACSFNHILGLPRKDGLRKPLFDYEEIIYKALLQPGYRNNNPALHSSDPHNILSLKEKPLWVKKATGLGITFILRFMARLCLRNDDYRNSLMCIVTAPQI